MKDEGGLDKWIVNECMRIAYETGYRFEDVIDAAIDVNLDMELVNVLANMYCLDSFNRKRVKGVIRLCS